MDSVFALNNLLWLGFVLADLVLAVVVFRFFGKQGLYVLIVASVIVANIQVTKTILLFGFTATLGNVLYGSTFFATDVLSELYGHRQARRGVWLGFAAMGLVVVWMQFGLGFVPGPDDIAHDSLTTIFGIMPRVAAGSLIAYLASQHHDISAFRFWKSRTQGRFLWLRNCASTMVSQAIDSLLFCFIALWGLYDTGVWLEILATTYILKWVVALLDTPFIYLAVRLHRQGLIREPDSLDT